MSMRKYFLFVSILIFAFSCGKKGIKEKKIDISKLNEYEKDSLAKQYDQIADYFLQPSELYRNYKDSALMVQPNNTTIMQGLSYSYKKVGDHIKAMEVLNKAIEIDTANNSTDVLEYRAWTLLYYYRDYEGVVRDVDLIKKITGNTYNACMVDQWYFN